MLVKIRDVPMKDTLPRLFGEGNPMVVLGFVSRRTRVWASLIPG